MGDKSQAKSQICTPNASPFFFQLPRDEYRSHIEDNNHESRRCTVDVPSAYRRTLPASASGKRKTSSSLQMEGGVDETLSQISTQISTQTCNPKSRSLRPSDEANPGSNGGKQPLGKSAPIWRRGGNQNLSNSLAISHQLRAR